MALWPPSRESASYDIFSSLYDTCNYYRSQYYNRFNFDSKNTSNQPAASFYEEIH